MPVRVSETVPHSEALEVFVDLLAETEPDGPKEAFYGRLCEAVCQLTSMERAILFLYDDARHEVRAVGGHGIDPAAFAETQVTIEVAPIAERAFVEDSVIEVSENIDDAVPAAFAQLFGVTTLTCTPLAASGRRLGVLLADRGGGRFVLTDSERHALWSLGRMAALAVTARIATRQQHRANLLTERIELAREVHDRVIQRLFGVSLALSLGRALTEPERKRCESEMQAALTELRNALQRPLAAWSSPNLSDTAGLRDELDRLRRHYADVPITVDWPDAVEVPPQLESLAQTVVAEALRNVAKHAQATTVEICVSEGEETFNLDVYNDGVVDGVRGSGIGLRLAALEALQFGGVVEFGTVDDGRWRVGLIAPVKVDG